MTSPGDLAMVGPDVVRAARNSGAGGMSRTTQAFKATFTYVSSPDKPRAIGELVGGQLIESWGMDMPQVTWVNRHGWVGPDRASGGTARCREAPDWVQEAHRGGFLGASSEVSQVPVVRASPPVFHA